jgi:hypothetical protein
MTQVIKYRWMYYIFLFLAKHMRPTILTNSMKKSQISVLQHLQHFPKLTSCDIFMFQKLKHSLKSLILNNLKEILSDPF